MNYRNGNIALIGNTTLSLSEHKVVVWDSIGNLKWSSAASLLDQGWATDVLIDSTDNTYTLCQNFGATQTEIELTKYSLVGSVIYRQAFNIGIDATSGRMEFLPNRDLVITGTNGRLLV
ncbi:MAG: hypothetical protein IPK10_00545 [Bacteroidetes bacterium]|nr:hypothetical protein [Bacteroidota bacterium]